MVINYENVQIELPYEVLNIEKLHLIAQVNEHHTLSLEALINEENAEEYLEESLESKDVRLTINGKVIYVGKIIKLEIHYKGQVAKLKLNSISYSYDLDIKKHKQAFYNLQSTYEDVVAKVLSKYSNTDFKDNITYRSYIKDLLVQYEETDFEFIKRLASYFETVIVVDATSNRSRFNFGIEIIDSQVELEKDFKESNIKFDDFTKILSVSKDNLIEQNFIGWKVEGKEYISLGNQLAYEGQKVIVSKVEMKQKKGEFIYVYELKFLNGIKKIHQLNSKLKGVSLEGIVKNRRNNEIQVHFSINDEYEDVEGNKWFSYGREVSNFYCMPLIGDKVHITFLSSDEKDTIVTNVVRNGDSSSLVPSNKSYSTENGQELLIAPEMLQISADEGKSIQISLNNNGSVSITGDSINLKSSSNVEIGNNISSNSNKNVSKPDSINISAKNKVTITRASKGINTAQSIQLAEENHLRGIIKMS
ncbi:hypothetical protein [Clostridium saccharobutylicum]|uniref:hypothetical protein n=1 Tax=Clostridium saccharobutylicum TaxID=169679 RepID=UPI00040FBD02|nr:hypothetical protein [Clostridium saccharobutylicum]AQR91915.1 hypothetical protein CLOSC_36430 [Clostridium saccharobutylicum]AQS01817.1 hypothetical protein CSACC_36480 [Clostridium saccharobutylicum]AQS15800.1 hypothetical protein CLOSACC_36480 [Clostridium saccharobutylicum]MBA8788397.1 hypothetical protein [Clostridium saccharobutylicum]MBA8895078.1 hypothetical protein [Clostridium saccharobutylicum]